MANLNMFKYCLTPNVKDFKTSEIVVLTPDEFCLKY